VNYNKFLLFIHLLMHIPKCQGVFNRTVINLMFDLIYLLFNKVPETWKNFELLCRSVDQTSLYVKFCSFEISLPGPSPRKNRKLKQLKLVATNLKNEFFVGFSHNNQWSAQILQKLDSKINSQNYIWSSGNKLVFGQVVQDFKRNQIN